MRNKWFFTYTLSNIKTLHCTVLFRFIIYGSYALAFWHGVKLIMDDRYAIIIIINIFIIMDFREVCIMEPGQCAARYTPASLLIVRKAL